MSIRSSPLCRRRCAGLRRGVEDSSPREAERGTERGRWFTLDGRNNATGPSPSLFPFRFAPRGEGAAGAAGMRRERFQDKPNPYQAVLFKKSPLLVRGSAANIMLADRRERSHFLSYDRSRLSHAGFKRKRHQKHRGGDACGLWDCGVLSFFHIGFLLDPYCAA